jgi:hypothetical protein
LTSNIKIKEIEHYGHLIYFIHSKTEKTILSNVFQKCFSSFREVASSKKPELGARAIFRGARVLPNRP